MLFSRIDARPNARRIEIDSTEIGMLAATVRPARSPTYTVTAPKMIPKIAPRISARTESSLGLSSADTNGRKVVVVVAIRRNLLATKSKAAPECTSAASRLSRLLIRLSGLPHPHRAPVTRHNRQPLVAKNPLLLRLGMRRPWPARIQLDVPRPVPQSPPRLLHTLIRQRQVIVCVGVLRNQLQRALIGRDRLRQPLQLIQDIAEVEECQRVLRIGLRRAPIQRLRGVEVALVIANSSQVDRCCRMLHLNLEDLAI